MGLRHSTARAPGDAQGSASIQRGKLPPKAEEWWALAELVSAFLLCLLERGVVLGTEPGPHASQGSALSHIPDPGRAVCVC